MKLIAYVAHPISGDVSGNLKKIRNIVREINLKHPGIVPFVPYYADCVSMDDSKPEERRRGISNDIEFFKRKSFDELWLYGDRISNGMAEEIKLAYKYGIPIIAKTQGTLLWKNEIVIETDF